MYKLTVIGLFMALNSLVAAAADLTCEMSASSNTARSGEDITYTIIVRNNGPSVARSVQTTTKFSNSSYKSHQVSQGSCQTGGFLGCKLGTIADRQTAEIGFTVTITATGKRKYKMLTTVSGPDGKTSCTAPMTINY